MDRLGFGNDRAVANARRAALQREAEERMVAELLVAIRRGEEAARARQPVRVDRAA
jgi:hypothetical protein